VLTIGGGSTLTDGPEACLLRGRSSWRSSPSSPLASRLGPSTFIAVSSDILARGMMKGQRCQGQGGGLLRTARRTRMAITHRPLPGNSEHLSDPLACLLEVLLLVWLAPPSLRIPLSDSLAEDEDGWREVSGSDGLRKWVSCTIMRRRLLILQRGRY
jgi:hypothetical protein